MPTGFSFEDEFEQEDVMAVLKELTTACSSCRLSQLHPYNRGFVYRGNPHARIAIVGDAPGDSETEKGVPDTAQVNLTATQYENVFEDLDSFKVQSIDSAAANTAATIVSSGALAGLSSDEAAAINEVSQFSQGRASANAELLIQFLQKLAANPAVDFGPLSNLASINATNAQITAMTSPFAGGAASINSYPGIKSQLTNEAITNKWTYGDCLLLHAMIGLVPGSTATGSSHTTGGGSLAAAAAAPSASESQQAAGLV